MTEFSDALERLSGDYYNDRDLSVDNPGGFGNDGHETNFFLWTADVATVTAYMADAAGEILGAGSAAAAAAGYAADAKKFLALSKKYAEQASIAFAIVQTADLHRNVTSDAVHEVMRLATNLGVTLGGLAANTTGEVSLVNAAGSPRLTTNAAGDVVATSDAGVTQPLATQAFAIAAAISL